MRRSSAPILGTLLAIILSGCGQKPEVDARALTADLTGRLSIPFDREPPPPGSPGLANLRATYSGAASGQRLTVLDFYAATSTQQVIGAGTAPARPQLVLRRRNLIVLYERTAATAPDRSAVVRAALAAAPLNRD